MAADHLSRDKKHLAELQRKRRGRFVRIDYMPGEAALNAIELRRATLPPGTTQSTNSAILDAIVCDWARLSGIRQEIVAVSTAPAVPGIKKHVRACANDFGSRPELPAASRAPARAYEFDEKGPAWAADWYAASNARKKRQRVKCMAQRHRDGQPCQALSEPGKRRCRFHGGKSTGPRSPEGKAKALANLRQFRSDRT